jgi:flagellar biosynthetic protein FliR
MNFDVSNWLLVFVRVSALLAAFPLFSAQNVPVRVRIALGAMIAFLIAPTLPAVSVAGLNLWSLFRLLFMEACVGLVLGFACRMIFFAIEFAGGVIANEMGLQMAASFNPMSNTPSPAPGMILYWLAIMLLLGLDMHHWMLMAFQKSYAVLPVGGAHPGAAVLTDMVARSSRTFVIALEMTAPMIAVSFIITLVFSVLGRAVPQMNVFTESMPVKALAGLMVFGLTCHLMAAHISNALRRLPEDMLRVAQLLAG